MNQYRKTNFRNVLEIL